MFFDSFKFFIKKSPPVNFITYNLLYKVNDETVEFILDNGEVIYDENFPLICKKLLLNIFPANNCCIACFSNPTHSQEQEFFADFENIIRLEQDIAITFSEYEDFNNLLKYINCESSDWMKKFELFSFLNKIDVSTIDFSKPLQIKDLSADYYAYYDESCCNFYLSIPKSKLNDTLCSFEEITKKNNLTINIAESDSRE